MLEIVGFDCNNRQEGSSNSTACEVSEVPLID